MNTQPHRQTLRALAASATSLAALAGFSGAAAAQANVTIFGLLDVGVQQIKGGNKTLRRQSIDGLQTSRLGVSWH